nr:type II toxin-antitoxin system prevent-host-death family antitoxin [Streptomyces griseus]
MTYTESRARYAETLNAVVDDREEVIVTRAGHDPVVIVALDEYESLKETACLLRSPENARRLLASTDRLEAAEAPFGSWRSEVRPGRGGLGRLRLVAGTGPEDPQADQQSAP